jgi:hypothetical protein
MNFHHVGNERFDTARALTEDELRASVPSVFATSAHESRSARFTAIPTIEVIRALASEGFSVVGAKQAIAKVEGRKPFAKHLLRIRQLGQQHKVGDTVFEMLLKNANDGTSIYDFMAGLFRIACLNSCVAAISTLEHIRVRHSGDVVGKVIEGSYRVIGEAQKALAAPADWSGVQLSGEERTAFAESAHSLRFTETSPIPAAALLVPRRVEDTGRDLWTTFNVVQENAIRGGLVGVGNDRNGRLRQTTSREIKGIDQDVKLNKALWMLGEKMHALKTAA